MLHVVMLSVKCRYAKCCYAKCHYSKCRYAKCHYSKCRYAYLHYAVCQVDCSCPERGFAEFGYAECHHT
jgi:hypothetical protein